MKIRQETVPLLAVTVIDTVTNLVEIVRLANKTSQQVALQFVNTWLARYPRPQYCIHDQGGEFLGWEFQEMLQRYGIISRATTAKNPQANAVCERMHQSVGNTLRVLWDTQPPQGINDAVQLVDTAIATAVYATRTTFNSSLNATPGGLAFHRDMVLDLPFHADLTLLQERRQQIVDQRLLEANRKRITYDYEIGQRVLKIIPNPEKLGPRAEETCTIETVHTNGTITIRLSPTTTERISLRRVKPYHQ